MMRIVHLLEEVLYRQLQLVKPQTISLLIGRKPQARAKIKENVGRLRDDQLTVLEKRRGEGRPPTAPPVHQRHHRGEATRLPRHIAVLGGGSLKGKTNELAPPLDFRPVIELVDHEPAPSPRHAFSSTT